MIMLVEHGLLMIKLFIEAMIDDTPPEIFESERERNAIIEDYNEMRASSVAFTTDRKSLGETNRYTQGLRS
jgi:hypothetical protein